MNWFDRWFSWLNPWRQQHFRRDLLRAAMALAEEEADWRLQHGVPLVVDLDLVKIGTDPDNQRKLENAYRALVLEMASFFQWDAQAIYQHVHRDVTDIIRQMRPEV